MLDEVAALLGPGAVTDDVPERRAKARDCWPRLALRERAGEALPIPDLVVRPATVGQVSSLLAWASARGVAVTPYGGGSGVVGGAACGTGIALDLTGLAGLVDLDPVSGVATFRAGTMGPDAEGAANAAGFTIGHFPSSVMCSTVGGWVSARGAGQLSTRYGKAEDLVVGLEAVLPDGTVWSTVAAPRTAAGPDLWRLLAGAEGTLGVITAVTLRLHPLPEVREFGAWRFPAFLDGVAALRAVMATGARPAVLRLYDDDARLVTVREGAAPVVRAEGEVLAAACAGAEDLGPGPAEEWWAHRYDVSFGLPAVLSGRALGPHGIADTLEVAALWSRLPGLYAAMRAALAGHVDAVRAHVSHCYPEGASVYWTFASAAADEADALRRYDAAWAAATAACRAAGGTIAHHHGVGRARAAWLPDELGAGYAVLRAVKAALDPAGVCNPGGLGLHPTTSPRTAAGAPT